MRDDRHKDKILEERAESLAKIRKTEGTRQGGIELVEFILASERYGIESVFIREIYPLKDVTLVPGVPDFVYGLINIRRRIVSVIDLRKLFDMPAPRAELSAKAIVLHNEQMEFGILAEEVVGLRTVHTADLQDSLPTLTGIHQEFFKGITADRLLVLDAEKLLMSPTIIVEQGADI